MAVELRLRPPPPEDAHEHGMLRVLVNILIWTSVGILVFMGVWMTWG